MTALNFPPQPQDIGNTYVGGNGVTYVWNGTIWSVAGNPGSTGNVTFSGNTISTVDNGNVVMQAGGHLWTFDISGTLSLDPGQSHVYSAPLIGQGDGLAVIDFELVTSITGLTTAWAAAITNPGSGYSNGQSWNYDSTFLGIPGASVTILITAVDGSGHITDISFTQPPSQPSDIYRDSPILIQVGNNATRWSLGANGNLTLPAGGTINFADGSNALTGGGGAANTGNVTFSDINIIGTGNLHLQPDPNDAGSFLDIYITTGPDIHIAGNGENLILGRDGTANVLVGVDGSVKIQSNAGNAHVWTFDTDGTTTFPGNLEIVTHPFIPGTIITQTDASIQLAASGDTGGLLVGWVQYPAEAGAMATVSFNTSNGDIRINTGNLANTSYTWDYLNDGNLVLPSGGIIGEGITSIPGVGIASTIELTPPYGGDPNQRLVIYPTAAEGNHLHMTSGNLQVTDIFLGDDAQFFKTNTDGSMSVGTGVGPGGFGGNVWTFDTNGALTFPSGAGFAKGDSGILKTNDSTTQALDLRDVTGAGFYTDTPGFVLRSNGTYNWTFDRDGNLTLPASGTISYTPTTSSDWNTPAPTTIQDALDRLAAVVKVLNGGTGA